VKRAKVEDARQVINGSSYVAVGRGRHFIFLSVSTCHDAPTVHTKIEVSSFNRSGDRRGSQILKGGHVTRATPTLGAFYVCRLVLAMAQLHTKFEVSSFKCSGDRRGSQILKESNTPTLGAFYVLSVSTGHNAATYQI